MRCWQQPVRQDTGSWGCIQDHTTPTLVGGDRGRVYDRQWNLQLQHQHGFGVEAVSGPLDLARADPSIGARRYGDQVLTALFDQDERDAGWLVGVSVYGRGVHPVGGERLQQQIAKRVLADAADHTHRAAEARGGDGLIGAFAARERAQPVAEYRLRRPRQARNGYHQVRVQAAKDDNAPGRTHWLDMMARLWIVLAGNLRGTRGRGKRAADDTQCCLPAGPGRARRGGWR